MFAPVNVKCYYPRLCRNGDLQLDSMIIDILPTSEDSRSEAYLSISFLFREQIYIISSPIGEDKMPVVSQILVVRPFG